MSRPPTDELRVRDLVDDEPSPAVSPPPAPTPPPPVLPQVVVESAAGPGDDEGPSLPFDPVLLVVGLRQRASILLALAGLVVVLSVIAGLAVRTHTWRVFATVLRKSEQKEYLVTGSTQPIVKLQNYDLPTLLRLVKATENLEEVLARVPLEVEDVAQLSASIRVENPRDTEIIEVIMDWPDPAEAAAAVNALVEIYVAHVDRLQKLEAIQAHDYLSAELVTVRQRLGEISRELVAFKEAHQLVELSAQAGRLLAQVAEFDALARKERLDAEMAHNALEQTRLELAEQSPTVVASVFLKRPLESRLVALEAELAATLAVYTDQTPQVKQLEDEIARVRTLIESGIQRDIAEETVSRNPLLAVLEQELVERRVESVARSARADGYDRVVDELRQRLLELPELERRLADLSQRQRTLEEIEATLAERVEEVRIIRDSTAANLSVTQLARIPRQPLPSKARPVAAACLVLGLGLVAAVGVGREVADRSLRSTREVESAVAVPCLGEVPHLAPAQTLIRDLDGTTVEIFRRLVDRLLVEHRPGRGWAVMVAGAAHFEGRTTVAANLARMASERGLGVCLVDADLRKPNLDAVAPSFGADLDGRGLAPLLRGECRLDEALLPTARPDLVWLPVGSGAASPELFHRGNIGAVLDRLRRRFDLVLVDAPPLLEVSDGLTVATAVDAVAYVAEAGAQPRAAHREALARLAGTGVEVLGLILNKVTEPYLQPYGRGRGR